MQSSWEGSTFLSTRLGTIMMYRVFDFHLGFGLVLAFFSAACCTFLAYILSFQETTASQSA